MRIRQSLPDDHDALLGIWLRSVRASHRFLTEADIQGLLPAVSGYLAAAGPNLWTLCSDESQPIGFMGMAGDEVEALFLAPEQAGRGGGRMLLEHARTLARPLRVDVNEQNAEAVQFYLANGFVVTGRSPVDSGGRPFPLLHMREDES
jgi:putative acetyltransferase